MDEMKSTRSCTVLIIDDEALFREDLASLLEARGLKCRTASSAGEGLDVAARSGPDLILCDIALPDQSGIAIVEDLISLSGGGGVIMITAHGSLDTAIEAFRNGALDYILKPLVIDDVMQKVRRFLHARSLSQEIGLLRTELANKGVGGPVIYRSALMQEVMELAGKVAAGQTPVLISGATGVGKEVVARFIHDQVRGGVGAFVPVNCAAIPESLLESELFGHERGAFTGAEKTKPGFFELADGGTLFLDEITEMRLEMQAKLLRAIDERSIYRIGSTLAREIDVKILAASNREIEEECAHGRFRKDLYYRLAVVELKVPPLKARLEDIEPLAEHFLQRYAAELKRPCPRLTGEVLQLLLSHDWPGNVRELENAIERSVLLGEGDTVDPGTLPPAIGRSDPLDGSRSDEIASLGSISQGNEADDLRVAVGTFERAHIYRILREAGGNREEAARSLGINPSTLYRKLSELG
jgi:DNA-binding NtrC family response regulator